MHRLWYDGTTKDLRWLRAINDDVDEVDLRRLSVLVPRNATAPHRRHLDLLFGVTARGVELRGNAALTEAALLEVFAEESGAGEDAAIDIRERGMELGQSLAFAAMARSPEQR